MRKVKGAVTAIAVLATLAGSGTGAWAQSGSGPGPGGPGMVHGKRMMECGQRAGLRMGPGARLDMMTAHLGLTPEQRYKILPILDDQFKEMKEVWDDDNLTRAQARAKMIAIHDKCFERMKGILTPEQKKKAEELKARMIERCELRQKRMGQPAPVPQK